MPSKRPLGLLPIFRDEDLHAYLTAMAPYVCEGRCVEVRAERERRAAEWAAMPQAEKDAQRERITKQLEAVLERIKGGA